MWFASKQSLSYLDGSLPGDYGFDPLGLSDPEGTGGFIEPRWLAYGEVINGRYAMMGAVGAIAPEILGKLGLVPPETALPWFKTGTILVSVMTSLQASTSYGAGFAVSSFPSPPPPPPPRHRTVVTLAKAEPTEKSMEIMRKFSEQYARRSGTYFCMDKGVTSVVIKGLAEHRDTLGAPLCPCRHYDDKAAEVQQGFWNCPCVPMRERKECHCMLFLTPDNDFAGSDQSISVEEIKETTANM